MVKLGFTFLTSAFSLIPPMVLSVLPEHPYTDMCCLTTGVNSEICVVRQFRCVQTCTYANLDSIAYYTPRLYGI